MTRGVLVLLGLALTFAACDADTGPIDPRLNASNVFRVDVAPAVDTIFVADTLRESDQLQLSAQIIGIDRQPIVGGSVIWITEDSSVAVVSQTGVVRPVSLGTVRIAASARVKGYATVVVARAARRVAITPRTDTIIVDAPISRADSIRLVAKAVDDSGLVVVGTRFIWTSASPSVATVDSVGTVRAVAPGVTSVSASAISAVGSASVTVLPVLKDIGLSAPATTILALDTLLVTATARGYDDRPVAGRKFIWTTSDNAVATVDTAGRVIARRVGAVTITATSGFRTASIVLTVLARSLVSVRAGGDFSCGTTVNGRLYCWGKGDLGQLAAAGDSLCFDSFDLPSPQRLSCALSPKRDSGNVLAFRTLSLGGTFACGIALDSKAYCWGSDLYGQLGDGSTNAGGGAPRLVTVRSERFDSISTGANHACALTAAGKAFCWGRDSTGQLGDARRVNSTTPIPVYPDSTFRSISAGGFHTCAITVNAQAFCWGWNRRGQLGVGSIGGIIDFPATALPGGPYVSISAGYEHTCGLRADGTALCWGDNRRGQLGVSLSPTDTVPFPAPTQVLPVSPFARIVAGGFAGDSTGRSHTCALDPAGVAWCWGDNYWKQSGSDNSSVTLLRQPTPIPGQPAGSFTSLSVGYRHACAMGAAGRAWCWGSNVFGALGNGFQAAGRSSPQAVEQPR